MKLEENIARMEQELADMKKQLEQQDKLELKGGLGYAIWTRNHITPIDTKIDNLLLTRGAFRATKELAEQADAMMVKRNRLEAYVHQLQGNSEGEYSIYYIPQNAKYSYVANSLSFIGSVKMLESTAIKLSKALTTGEISI